MPVGNLESNSRQEPLMTRGSWMIDGACTLETDPLLIPVASQSADSSLARSTACSSHPGCFPAERKDRWSSRFGQDQGDSDSKCHKPSEASHEPFFFEGAEP
eukprot:scpid110553/ scgid25837/ 